ncbi:MAG: SurA N-terminal domain-containing protein [Arenibacterium sp.]
MATKSNSMSKGFVWVIVILLIIGLAGFGATNLSGTIRTVGFVGDQVISVDKFAREFQREVRAIEAQTREPLPMTQARELGLEQVVLSRLVQLAALDHEADEIGISIGDENLQAEIVEIPAFQGLNGEFDRDTYSFALSQVNLSETEFEEDLRQESARSILQVALMTGVQMPDAMSDMLVDYVGARRNFIWAVLDASTLETPVAEPSAAQLREYYDGNTEQFMLPETREITYALLTPEMILDEIEIDDSSVRSLYDEREAQYDQPERRLVERLVFSDQDSAASALAQVEVGGTTFELLVEERGLSLQDVDLGDVAAGDLGAASDAVFAAETGDVVGPFETSLGPALFRVNGILEAQVTSFEDVQAELRDELAGERARRQIESRAEALEDILAGGATLEELTEETEMELGTISWSEMSDEAISAYAAFSETARQVGPDDFPEIDFLEDGSVFALRLNEVLPPRPEEFETAQQAVRDAVMLERTRDALSDAASDVVNQLANSGDFTETGLRFKVENGLTRTAYIEGAPADFMNSVFEMSKGDVQIVPGEGAEVLIVRLEGTLPPEDNSDLRQLRAAISQQMDQTLAQALFSIYARDTQLRSEARIDERALNAVMTSFTTGGF